jgi:hypothetical protein
MPFVNIPIYEGWGQDKLDEIARRVPDASPGCPGKRCGWSWRRSIRPSGTWWASPRSR